MLLRATLATVIATLCAPAVGDELQPYTVTVIEQIRHEITVEAASAYAAQTDALLEARRTSRLGKPWWEPSPPSILAHERQAKDFVAIDVESDLTALASYPGKIRVGLLDRVSMR